jgi:hypothetical protein
VGDEPFRATPERDALEESVKKFERRIKAVRFMAFLAVTFMTLVVLAGLIPLLRADEATSGRSLAIYVILILFGGMGISFGKLWFAMMVNHIALIKELKVVQLRILQGRAPSEES